METVVQFRAGIMQYQDKLLKADTRKGMLRVAQVSANTDDVIGSRLPPAADHGACVVMRRTTKASRTLFGRSAPHRRQNHNRAPK